MKTKPVFKNNGAQEQIVTLYFLELSICFYFYKCSIKIKGGGAQILVLSCMFFYIRLENMHKNDMYFDQARKKISH